MKNLILVLLSLTVSAANNTKEVQETKQIEKKSIVKRGLNEQKVIIMNSVSDPLSPEAIYSI